MAVVNLEGCICCQPENSLRNRLHVRFFFPRGSILACLHEVERYIDARHQIRYLRITSPRASDSSCACRTSGPQFDYPTRQGLPAGIEVWSRS